MAHENPNRSPKAVVPPAPAKAKPIIEAKPNPTAGKRADSNGSAAAVPAADLVKAVPKAPTKADVVEILEPIRVKFAGQHFALNKGGRVANKEFAHFLQEGNFPVRPVRQKGADA